MQLDMGSTYLNTQGPVRLEVKFRLSLLMFRKELAICLPSTIISCFHFGGIWLVMQFDDSLVGPMPDPARAGCTSNEIWFCKS